MPADDKPTRHDPDGADAALTGDQIRRIRDNLGLTQKGLGKKLDVSARSISLYEQGHISPPKEVIAKLLQLQTLLTQHLSPSPKPKYRWWFIPTQLTWSTWTISERAAYLGLLATFLFGPIVVVVSLTYTLGQRAKVVVGVVEGDPCVLRFTNTGESTVAVDVVDTNMWHTVLFVPTAGGMNNAGDLAHQYSHSVGMDEIAKIMDVRDLWLSPGDSTTRDVVAAITKEGTVASYDLRLRYKYQATSWLEGAAQKILMWTHIVDPKTEVFIRFDGCGFSQISGPAVNKRVSPAERTAAQRALRQCLERKHPETAKKLATLEAEQERFITEGRALLKEWTDDMVDQFGLHLLNRIPTSSGTEQINLCKLLWLVDEAREQRGMPVIHRFKSLDELVVYYTGMDTVFHAR